MIVTVRKMRAPGHGLAAGAAVHLGRRPRSRYVLLVIGPAMIAALTMLMIDRHFNGIFFDSQQGGAPLLYEHLAYIFFTGAYVIVFLVRRRGDLGDPADLRPQAALQPPRGRGLVRGVAVLGLLAWMQNMYIAPLTERLDDLRDALRVGARRPDRASLSNWIATLWGGALRLRAATWYALARDLDDVARARRRARLLGDPGRLGARQHHRRPGRHALRARRRRRDRRLRRRFTTGSRSSRGRLLGEGLGKAALGAILVGVHLYVLPMFLAGLEGQPVDVFKFYEDTGSTATT